MKDERKKIKKGGGAGSVSRFARSSSPLWVMEKKYRAGKIGRQEWKVVVISLSKGITICLLPPFNHTKSIRQEKRE